MTFNDLIIDLDSFTNEFVCESIMMDLYSSEYNEANVANESLSLTFDDEDTKTISPAFEEAKKSFGEKVKELFSKIGKIFTTIGNAIKKLISNLFKKKKDAESKKYDVNESGDEVVVVVEEPSSGKRTYKLSKKNYHAKQREMTVYASRVVEYLKKSIEYFRKACTAEDEILKVYNDFLKTVKEDEINGKSQSELIEIQSKKINSISDSVISAESVLYTYTIVLDGSRENVGDLAPEVARAMASYSAARKIDINDIIKHAQEMQKRCEKLSDDTDRLDKELMNKDALKCWDYQLIPSRISHVAKCIARCCSNFISAMSKWAGLVY